MEIIELQVPTDIESNKKLSSRCHVFEKFISELKAREIQPGIVELINQQIKKVNGSNGDVKLFSKELRMAQAHIAKLVEKELKLVTLGHHRTFWMMMGMSVFGLPMGVAFGASLGNMAFLGIGLPIGMAIGLAVGTSMDNKAKEEGRQLNVELK